MHWVDVEQNTEEWLELRKGKIGGSSITKVMANYGKAFGKPAHDQALRVALEKITGNMSDSAYTNKHMERGHEQEPIARMLYEDQTFCEVNNGGFFVFDDFSGVSPDGRVGESGLIEIKSVIGPVHFETVKRNAFDPAYKWQIYFNLFCSGMEWIDYVEYCSEFPDGKQLFIERIYENQCQRKFDMIRDRMKEFMALVNFKMEMIKAIK